MTGVKTDTVTFRIRPEIKAALRAAPAQEHRSLANRLEVTIRDSLEEAKFVHSSLA